MSPTSPYSDTYIDNQINGHSNSELIREIQNKSYKATSKIHKTGLDAASWLLGPFAGIGFGFVDDHRDSENNKAIRLLEKLIITIDMTERSQMIMLHLACTYPGRLKADEYSSYDRNGLYLILDYFKECKQKNQLKVDINQFNDYFT